MAVYHLKHRLKRFQLDGIQVTDHVLGQGAFASVVELEYKGLKCAGKKIHATLIEQNGISDPECRFSYECDILSQIRHPHIVQFLGVYFEAQTAVPYLVMEFLPANLASCIDRYGILVREISYSILHNVSLGLNYLHSHIPPIIHRDLSANNVLLTSNMTAKISDLGMAKILNITPLQISRMTGNPGTPTYMPPEVMVAHPRYNSSVDVFSFGIMMIHVFCGEWPHPKCEPVRSEPDDKLTPVSEAERRNDYLRNIGDDHPLMDLILKCVSNNPQRRGNAADIVQQLKEAVLRHPPTFANKVEMLNRIQALEGEKTDLVAEIEKKDVEIEQGHNKVRQVEALLTECKEENQRTVERLEFAYSMKTKQLQSNLTDLETQVVILTEEKKKRNMTMDSFTESIQLIEKDFKDEIETQKKKFRNAIKKEKKQFSEAVSDEKEKYEKILASHRMVQEMQKDTIEKLHSELEASKSEYTATKKEVCELQSEIEKMKVTLAASRQELDVISRSLARVEELNESKESALANKDKVIESLKDQLTNTREYLSTKLQPLQTKITWKKCADLPAPACLGQSTVINGSIYFGGFNTGSVKEGCNVYCYDPSQDAWSLLPPPPVWWFGLGQVHKQLVAVGGGRVSDDKMSNEVYVFDEKSQKWKPSFPAMPTARHSPAVISHPSALVVAGGETSERGVYVDTVEIFNIKASKWYSAPSLPMPCRDMSSVSIQDTCYFAGGRGNLAMLNQVLHASIDQLLHNAMLDQDCPDSSDNNQHSSAGWEKLPDTPSYRPTISVLDETIISIGGDSPSSGKPKSEVLVYSLKTGSWIYIGDLPSPCHGAAAAVVSPREMLVIGGWDDDGRKKTVYKGTLNAFV